MPAQLTTASAPARIAAQSLALAWLMSRETHRAIDRSAAFGWRAIPMISCCPALRRAAMADPIRPLAPIRTTFMSSPAFARYDLFTVLRPLAYRHYQISDERLAARYRDGGARRI